MAPDKSSPWTFWASIFLICKMGLLYHLRVLFQGLNEKTDGRMLSTKYKALYVRNYYFSSPSSWAQLKFTFVNPSSNCISTTHLWFNLDTLKFFFSFVWDQFLTPSENPRGLPLSPPQHMAQCWVHTLCWQTTPQAHWLWGPETGLLSNFYSTVCDPVESHLAETAVLCIQSPASTLFLMAHAWYPHPRNALGTA